jgi:hypothetical protein
MLAQGLLPRLYYVLTSPTNIDMVTPLERSPQCDAQPLTFVSPVKWLNIQQLELLAHDCSTMFCMYSLWHIPQLCSRLPQWLINFWDLVECGSLLPFDRGHNKHHFLSNRSLKGPRLPPQPFSNYHRLNNQHIRLARHYYSRRSLTPTFKHKPSPKLTPKTPSLCQAKPRSRISRAATPSPKPTRTRDRPLKPKNISIFAFSSVMDVRP